MSEIYKELQCIICPNSCEITVEGTVEEPKISGNRCKRGRDFALSELKCPRRTVCSTVVLLNSDSRLLPVRTEGPIPRDKISQAMKEIGEIKITAPVQCGDCVLENIADTGVKLIATATKRKKA